MTPVIRLCDVTAGYQQGPVIEDVSMAVNDGEFFGLVGPNGGGKSTLLKLVLGLLPPWAGHVSVLGTTPRRAVRYLGYVPQHAAFSRDFPISVRNVVLAGRLWPWRLGPRFARSDDRVAMQALGEAGVAGLAERPIDSLSGGELQRVLIARALATRPRILLLDEPTANVDPGAERDLFTLLRDINRRMTIVLVSHDIGFVSEYISHVACLNRQLVYHATEPLTEGVLARLYGHPVQAINHRRADHAHGGLRARHG